MEDRLWRHPSEVAAGLRATSTAVTVSTIRTPLKHAVGLATLGAVGGALVVTGLFVTLGSDTSAGEFAGTPVTEVVAMRPFAPVAQSVPADTWPTAVVETAAPGIARLVVTDPQGVTTGSGIMFRSDGYLLSSADLIGAAKTVSVTLGDGSTQEGTVVGTDEISGLAVVRVANRDAPTAVLGIMTAPPELGDYVVPVPGLADPGSLMMANISALSVNVPIDDTRNLHGLLQIDATMPDAGSGGGVVDDSGSVIGVLVDLGTRNGTYAVPISYARKVAADLITYGYAQHAWLGIKGVTLLDTTATDLGLDGAVRVQNVLLDSPAYAAGISKGDLIVAIDDAPIISMTELILTLRRHPPGDNIVITLQQDGHTLDKSVELKIRAVENTT